MIIRVRMGWRHCSSNKHIQVLNFADSCTVAVMQIQVWLRCCAMHLVDLFGWVGTKISQGKDECGILWPCGFKACYIASCIQISRLPKLVGVCFKCNGSHLFFSGFPSCAQWGNPFRRWSTCRGHASFSRRCWRIGCFDLQSGIQIWVSELWSAGRPGTPMLRSCQNMQTGQGYRNMHREVQRKSHGRPGQWHLASRVLCLACFCGASRRV